MEHVETNTTVAAAPELPVRGIARTIRDFVLWSYERGTVQYDVMVTLILLFVFLSPYWINFKDRPVDRNPHQTGVMVFPDGQGGLIYQIQAAAVPSTSDDGLRNELLQIIEPISGETSITKIEKERDKTGRVVDYRVWVEKH